MNKKVTRAFGKNIYLLGKDADGTLYWLEEAKWDCEWYWGFGYVETYTNNKYPERAKDISSHQHFDVLFFHRFELSYTIFKKFFVETPLSEEEIWELLEMMRSYYTAREYSDMIYRGGFLYTTNPCEQIIQNSVEYERINHTVLPAIFEEVYRLLTPSVE